MVTLYRSFCLFLGLLFYLSDSGFCCFNRRDRGGRRIQEWSYKDTRKWCDASRTCCGRNQSPIDLPSSVREKAGEAFDFEGYDQIPATMKIENNGHSVSVKITSDDVKPKIRGGELGKTYIFDSFHFHWGSRKKGGSEHTLDGKKFSMEMHLLHYSDSYDSVSKALETNDPKALAVLSVWILFSQQNNDALETLIDDTKNVSYNGQSIDIIPGFPLSGLLPSNTNKFYRYFGSLTTPMCNEVVQWTIFTTPVILSREQGHQFRHLYFTELNEIRKKMKNNFRPTQPRNDRPITLFNAS